LNCLNCGNPLPYHRSKFCSDKCREKWWHKQPQNRTIHTLVCQGCGKTYQNVNPKHKFCSAKCASKSHGDQRKRKYTCKHCGKVFAPSQAQYKTYCSRECSFAALHERKNRRAEQLEAGRNQSRQRVCAICGNPFEGKTSKSQYCSRECELEEERRRSSALDKAKFQPKHITCKQCGKTFTTQYGDKRSEFCSKKCLKRYIRKGRESNHRKRARKYGCEYKPVKPLTIFERDNWTCRICGRKTPKRLRGTIDNRAPELDHIIPLSLGGGHIEGNLQCACRECNGNKGARLVVQLPLMA